MRGTKVARGILSMINQDTYETTHILNYPDLTVKESFRIIYYDGEAALALLRLYHQDHNDKWLEVVKKLMDRFIEKSIGNTMIIGLGIARTVSSIVSAR